MAPKDDPSAEVGMPRWVKLAAIVAGLVILLVVVVMLVGGGNHGPRRHGLGALPAASATH